MEFWSLLNNAFTLTVEVSERSKTIYIIYEFYRKRFSPVFLSSQRKYPKHFKPNMRLIKGQTNKNALQRILGTCHVWLFVTSWTVAHQAPLSMGNSPGKNTGVGFHALLQGIFPTQQLNPGLLHWRRQWHPTPVLLPGKSHGWRSLVGFSPWGH